jgi:ribosomal protein S18 acetylase RimI-like enzyme
MSLDETSSVRAAGGFDLSMVLIRHLEKEDLIALEWEGEYTHFRRLYAQAYQRARQNKSVLWVADLIGQGVIGQLFVQLPSLREGANEGASRAYIYSFRVRFSYRNRGVGTRLMKVVEEDLDRRGVEIASLNVGRENTDARRLYERQGYQVVRAEPGIWQYVDHSGFLRTVSEPAWRMEKRLR